MTTIVIQSESGAATADDPDRARAAFAAIAGSGREALGELRRLLGLLRDEDESAAVGAAAWPGTRLGELVADTRAAGLAVDAQVDGDLDDLPAGVDLTAYQIVQEALTNALRHAHTSAAVRVGRDGGALVVEVRNPLAEQAPASRYGAGRGLAGMRERVRVYDGELTARAGLGVGGARSAAGGRGGPVTSVVIADDQELVRAGLRTVLDSRDGVEVVGEAANGRGPSTRRGACGRTSS